MDQKNNEKELIECQAFKMGKKSEARDWIAGYAETSEERDCFCF